MLIRERNYESQKAKLDHWCPARPEHDRDSTPQGGCGPAVCCRYSARPGLPEGRESGWAATRPAASVSAHGAVCQRQSARRGCGVFLGALKGIRAASPGFSKSVVSKRDRLV